jgi:hypothetical protein
MRTFSQYFGQEVFTTLLLGLREYFTFGEEETLIPCLFDICHSDYVHRTEINW